MEKGEGLYTGQSMKCVMGCTREEPEVDVEFVLSQSAPNNNMHLVPPLLGSP